MKQPRVQTLIERAINAIGSVPSLIIHTIWFVVCFALSMLGLVKWETMLLVLTTIVSLEAIYLALFIQITVNENTRALREVEEDIDEIQEDVEELGEDVEDIQEDIEEISEDIDEIQEDVEEMSDEGEHLVRERAPKTVKKPQVSQEDALNQLTKDVQRVLADLEALKKGK
ncbi:MAG: coiled-coil domain-containing protein [Bacillota bacterium]